MSYLGGEDKTVKQLFDTFQKEKAHVRLQPVTFHSENSVSIKNGNLAATVPLSRDDPELPRLSNSRVIILKYKTRESEITYAAMSISAGSVNSVY